MIYKCIFNHVLCLIFLWVIFGYFWNRNINITGLFFICWSTSNRYFPENGFGEWHNLHILKSCTERTFLGKKVHISMHVLCLIFQWLYMKICLLNLDVNTAYPFIQSRLSYPSLQSMLCPFFKPFSSRFLDFYVHFRKCYSIAY